MGQRLKAMLMLFGILFGEVLLITGLHMFLTRKSKAFEKTRKVTNTYQTFIREDIQCFPIPLAYRNEVTYEDSYGAARENGGHEGCDIMDELNKEGRIPIVSATDGEITNLGWLYLGGYRVGITSKHGVYYYYAHLNSYAAGLSVGKNVYAGELLGFMGSTGEGEEGTSGRFPVHLHFGIYIENEDGNDEAVNSYPYLEKIDGG